MHFLQSSTQSSQRKQSYTEISGTVTTVPYRYLFSFPWSPWERIFPYFVPEYLTFVIFSKRYALCSLRYAFFFVPSLSLCVFSTRGGSAFGRVVYNSPMLFIFIPLIFTYHTESNINAVRIPPFTFWNLGICQEPKVTACIIP